MGQQGEDETLPTAEVVVDLAQRDAGAVGDAAGRQVGVPVGEQGSPGRLDEPCRRVVQARATSRANPLSVGRPNASVAAFGRSTEAQSVGVSETEP